MSPDLDTLEQAFLGAVRQGGPLNASSETGVEASLAPGNLTVEAGLAIYRRNFRSTMQRCLEETYPSVQRRIGSETFARLVALCATRWPATDPDLNRYGEALVEAVTTYSSELDLGAEVADLARLEWAWQLIHQDPPPRAPAQPGIPTLVHPSVLIDSPHPLPALWVESPASAQDTGPCQLLVWRSGGGELRADPVPASLWPFLVAAASESPGDAFLELLTEQIEAQGETAVSAAIADLVRRGWLCP